MKKEHIKILVSKNKDGTNAYCVYDKELEAFKELVAKNQKELTPEKAIEFLNRMGLYE